jgi:hypothetical protein
MLMPEAEQDSSGEARKEKKEGVVAQNGNGRESWDLEVCGYEQDLEERITAILDIKGITVLHSSLDNEVDGRVNRFKQTAELVMFAGGGFSNG